MIPLDITPDVDRAPWTDLLTDPSRLINPADEHGNVRMALIERVGLLRHGTEEGRATVALVVRLADGRLVLAETTLRLARTAALALAASPVYAEEDFT